MRSDITALALSLPEDVLKAKWAGNFAFADRLIERHLADERTPACMRERLITERELIKRLPGAYPHTLEEGLAIARRELPDFTMEELLDRVERDQADWIYVNGQIHLADDFFSTLKKVQPDIRARVDGRPVSSVSLLLDENIAAMQREGSARWHCRLKVTLKIKDSSFRPGVPLTVHMPIPAEAINQHDIHLNRLNGGDTMTASIGSPDAPARTVVFTGTLPENHKFVIDYDYISEVRYHDLWTEEADKKAAWDQPEGDVLPEDLKEEAPQILFTPLVKRLAAELVGDEKNPLAIARAFYRFCTEKVTYSFMREYFCLDQIVDYCIAGLKGDCGVQALTFITLCRSVGIPARWQSGLSLEKNDAGCHDWAMFYVAPFGWLFADCSFGGSAFRAGAKVRHRYYFGNLDPFRMVANRAFMAELDPPAPHDRQDPYDNQSGEVFYEDRGLYRREFDVYRTVEELRKI